MKNLTDTQREQLRNVKKLLEVAAKFRNEGSKIDMDSWADSSDKKAPKLKDIYAGACQTTLCLAGRAGLAPYFRRRGLRTDFETRSTDYGYVYVKEIFSFASDQDSLDEMFGFTNDQSNDIFYAENVYTKTGRLSKKLTLDFIVKNIKAAALENFGVNL